MEERVLKWEDTKCKPKLSIRSETMKIHLTIKALVLDVLGYAHECYKSVSYNSDSSSYKEPRFRFTKKRAEQGV